ADGPPERVGGDPGQGDPDVAVEEALVGRPRGGVVVVAGPLNLGAVALGRRVVQREQQRPRGGQGEHGALEEQAGREGGDAAQRREEVGVAGEAAADAGGAEPGGDGAPPPGEQGAGEQDGQAPGGALVQEGGQGANQQLQGGGEVCESHGGS